MPQSFLASSGANPQAWTVPSDWNGANNSAEVIGPGGNGSARQSSSIGGNGGGAGSYAKKTNLSRPAGSNIYYLLPAGGAAVDAWFDDLNLLLQTDNNLGGTSWTTEALLSVTQSQSDPDGGSKATRIIESTANTYHGIYQASIAKPASVAISYGLVCYVKNYSGSRYLELFWFDPNAQYSWAIIDPTNGNVTETGSVGWGVPVVSVTDVGSGWYRVFMYADAQNNATTTLSVYARISNVSTTGGLVGIVSYTGDGTSGLYLYGMNLTYGYVDKGFTPTTTLQKFSALAKCGTNATIGAAGVGQSGSVGNTTAQGGGGFKPASGTIGGGGGGAAGPNGAGTTATTTAGGAADNSTVTGGAQGANGNNGTEWDATHGSGSGAGGRSGSSGNGFTGGNYGGGGSGCGTAAAGTGGAGAQALIAINYTPAVIANAIIQADGPALVRSSFW